MNHSKACRGVTLLEAILLITILSIVGLGVGIGLQSSARVADVNDQALVLSTELMSEMETWAALAWTSNTAWPTVFPYTPAADTVTLKIGGQNVTYARSVNIKNWDPNNLISNTSPKADFVRVQITINGQKLERYFAKPL